jgi:hypothetical protein
VVLVEVGVDDAAEDELDLFVPRHDREVLAQRLDGLAQFLQCGGGLRWVGLSGRRLARRGRRGWRRLRRLEKDARLKHRVFGGRRRDGQTLATRNSTD